MPTAYSTDLRERIVNAYLQDQGTHQTLATRFAVSHRTVQNYIRRYRRTGSVAPLPPSGRRTQQKLFEPHFKDIETWLDEDPNLCWWQVADKLKETHDLKIDPSQVCRMMKRRGYSRKKTPHATPK